MCIGSFSHLNERGTGILLLLSRFRRHKGRLIIVSSGCSSVSSDSSAVNVGA